MVVVTNRRADVCNRCRDWIISRCFSCIFIKKNSRNTIAVWAGWARSLVYALLGVAVLLSWLNQWHLLLGGFVIVILAIRYIAMTALYAHFMQTSSKEQAGTDFTILVCFELLVYFIGGAVSGFLAKAFGYGNFYLILAVSSVLSVLLSQLLIRKAKQTQQLI